MTSYYKIVKKGKSFLSFFKTFTVYNVFYFQSCLFVLPVLFPFIKSKKKIHKFLEKSI